MLNGLRSQLRGILSPFGFDFEGNEIYSDPRDLFAEGEIIGAIFDLTKTTTSAGASPEFIFEGAYVNGALFNLTSTFAPATPEILFEQSFALGGVFNLTTTEH